ncbi:hypothetical protein V6C32_08680 [Desulforamulus ruminis]|uniref:hypothetical protein n=1 Tax=Desulforamulus ruminis TaxID=1564 RepID=UPI002FDA8C76
MEWALGITRGEDLHRISNPREETGSTDLGGIKGAFESFGAARLNRLYFGQEFCERAIPTPGELREAMQRAREHKLDFTLVTPYITEKGLSKLEILFKELAAVHPAGEVVVNDWGVLYLLNKRFPTLTPILGRLMNKILRDPRINRFIKEENSNQMQPFRNSSLSEPYMQKLLKGLNVTRIELDHTFQGFPPDLERWGYQLSLYIPYGCITSGRACLFGSWGLAAQQKFNATGKSCSGQCRFHRLMMHDRSGQVAGNHKEWRIFQKGNTVFYEQMGDFLTRGIIQAKELGFSRIVYQPEPI